MAQQSEFVKSGLWRDRSQSAFTGVVFGPSLQRQRAALLTVLGSRILVTDRTAQIISDTVAVALTLALPRLLRLVQSLLPLCSPFLRRVWRYIKRPKQTSGPPG